MEKTFKYATNLIIVCLVISTILHLALYASDSAEYTQWVTLQITIQMASITTLMFVKKYIFKAFVIFVFLSVPFSLINAVYVNYGDFELHAALFILFWVIYGGLVYRVRNSFNVQNGIA